MKILIAEDDSVSRRLLEETLKKWGYEVCATTDGTAAWEALQSAEAPSLAILDWMMPGMDGVEICRRVRREGSAAPPYIILLTANSSRDNVIYGFESGADDYLIKPYDHGELRARLRVGERMLNLQRKLAERVHQLEDALASVKQLQELLPICSYCKSIRDDHNYWQSVDRYITEHTQTQFSHGICPDCYQRIIQPEIEKLRGPQPSAR